MFDFSKESGSTNWKHPCIDHIACNFHTTHPDLCHFVILMEMIIDEFNYDINVTKITLILC